LFQILRFGGDFFRLASFSCFGGVFLCEWSEYLVEFRRNITSVDAVTVGVGLVEDKYFLDFVGVGLRSVMDEMVEKFVRYGSSAESESRRVESQ